MRSLVVLGANGELLSDSSWEEAEEDYLPPDSATELICDLDSVECVVLDARHISAARTLADVGHERGALVILDPGSTVGALFRSDAERTAVRSLVAKCDVVLGSDSFYKALANTDAVADAVEAALELGPQLIVATAKDGTCCCTSRRFDFQVAPIRVSTAGNSLGAGDLFKGWFAAELLSRAGSRTDKLLLTYENTLEATRVAVAAAAWRISDHGMFVEIPSDDEVRHLAMQPVTR